MFDDLGGDVARSRDLAGKRLALEAGGIDVAGTGNRDFGCAACAGHRHVARPGERCVETVRGDHADVEIARTRERELDVLTLHPVDRHVTRSGKARISERMRGDVDRKYLAVLPGKPRIRSLLADAQRAARDLDFQAIDRFLVADGADARGFAGGDNHLVRHGNGQGFKPRDRVLLLGGKGGRGER